MTKNNLLFITYVMVTVIAATVSISAVFSLNDAQGQIIILSPIAETLDNTISLNILFANNTNATLVNEPSTEAQGNANGCDCLLNMLMLNATNYLLTSKILKNRVVL